MTDREELRKLAEAATPGPWWHEWVDGDDWWAVYGQPTGDMVCPEVCTMGGADESAYIAAANPAAVLGLLDEADALRADLRTAEARATAAEVASRGYRERAEKVEAERDAALRTMDEHRCDEQAERVYGRAMRAEAERDALCAQVESVRQLAREVASLPSKYTRAPGENGDRVADLLSEDAYRLGAAIRAALTPPTTTEEEQDTQ